MVRSAGMHFCSNAIEFVPDLRNIISFEKHIGKGDPDPDSPAAPGASPAGAEDGSTASATASAASASEPPAPRVIGADLSPESVQAAKNLDAVIANLSQHFSESVDYFKVLVNEDLIVPALTINFVDTILQAKDRMYKSARGQEAYFTDDGFAIGLAYILAILKQSKKFGSLHWFECVERKYTADAEELRKLSVGKKSNDEDLQTLQLTAKRIEGHKREFELLYFSLSGAQIFFKED
jgi:WASH complex subunit 7